MAFCKYCGTKYPDGGVCKNSTCPRTDKGFASESNHFAHKEAFVQPANKTSKRVLIAFVLVVLLLVAVVVVIVFLLNNRKKEKEAHMIAVETYAKSLYEKKGYEDFIKITMLDDALKDYNKTDDYDKQKKDFEERIEKYNEQGITISFDRVEKCKKLSNNELEAAKSYFDMWADGINISKGYEYKIEFKLKINGNTSNKKEKVCVVNVKGDGWKVIHWSADILCYRYGESNNNEE